jgi:hypothetical protein
MLLEHSACERPGTEVVRLLRLARRQDVQTQLIHSLGGNGGWQSIIESFTDRDRLIKIREFAEQVILFSKVGDEACASDALSRLVTQLREKELDDGAGCIDPDLAGI